MSYDRINTLFLGDLSLFCTEKDLQKLFGKFGPLQDIRLKRSNDQDRTSLSYGFVKFAHKQDAAKALQELDGFMLLGRAIKLENPPIYLSI